VTAPFSAAFCSASLRAFGSLVRKLVTYISATIHVPVPL
jgi:hypothetical protein